MTTKTLYDKIVDLHTIEKLSADGIERLVYIDRTVVNEYTSPQAFSLLRENGLTMGYFGNSRSRQFKRSRQNGVSG